MGTHALGQDGEPLRSGPRYEASEMLGHIIDRDLAQFDEKIPRQSKTVPLAPCQRVLRRVFCLHTHNVHAFILVSCSLSPFPPPPCRNIHPSWGSCLCALPVESRNDVISSLRFHNNNMLFLPFKTPSRCLKFSFSLASTLTIGRFSHVSGFAKSGITYFSPESGLRSV